MNKAKKITVAIILALVALILAFTLVTYIIHRVKTHKELDALSENGLYNPVSVGDYSLNVAKFGNENGNHTIVAMAGLGMGDCSVTMRQMTKCLENDNLIVFVDRAGYGLSGDTKNEMTLEYIVEDYRKALNNAGIKGPYILMPHSIGGAYATYWCSKYPEEIEAVVFVDGSQLSSTAFDEDDEEYKSTWLDRILTGFANLGFSRYVLRNYSYEYPDNYSKEEQYLGDALALKTLNSTATLSECDLMVENAQKAFNTVITNNVPKLYICASWGFETGDDFVEYTKWINRQKEKNNLGEPMNENPDKEVINKVLQQCDESRQSILIPYLEKMGNCQLVCLGGDHMIYQQKPTDCGNIIKSFVDDLDN